MYYDQFSDKNHSAAGALQINLRAVEQKKNQHRMQAIWSAETKPANVQKHIEIQAWFARLQTGMSVLSRHLVSASR